MRTPQIPYDSLLDDMVADGLFRTIVDRLNVAVFVFGGSRIVYKNEAADRLGMRLRERFAVELPVMLRDQLARLNLPGDPSPPRFAVMFTTERGEPLHLYVVALDDGCVVVTVRELGANLSGFRSRYGLSGREAEVAELVLRGYRNREVAAALGITIETAKKHLSRVFDKVGVDSRIQLANRLA